MADVDRRLHNVSNTIAPIPVDPKTGSQDGDVLSEDLTPQMIRRPTEEDFAQVLTPEGAHGDLFQGADVSDSTTISNSDLGGTE